MSFCHYAIMPIAKKSSVCNGFQSFAENKMEAFLGFAAPQQFSVDFRKPGKLTLKSQMRRDAGAGLFPLFRCLEQEFPHPAGPEALHQIEERPML